MSMSKEITKLQVTFPKEKLEALRFYMGEKDLTVEGELQKYMSSIYDKYVPTATRKYFNRNDKVDDIQSNLESNRDETTRATAKKKSTGGIKKSKKIEASDGVEETINIEDQDGIQEINNEENQGMEISM